MPRIDKMLGDVAQSPSDSARGGAVMARSDVKPQSARSVEKTVPSKRREFHGPCCKTCKGVSCTGHCKF